ncbi:MAG: hypothetical protein NTV48_01430 [Candidatus Vogelbacteria bacterium]|nr:hypothetical protein [Candidatus Vogelbacteria bacterium]
MPYSNTGKRPAHEVVLEMLRFYAGKFEVTKDPVAAIMIQASAQVLMEVLGQMVIPPQQVQKVFDELVQMGSSCSPVTKQAIFGNDLSRFAPSEDEQPADHALITSPTDKDGLAKGETDLD